MKNEKLHLRTVRLVVGAASVRGYAASSPGGGAVSGCAVMSGMLVRGEAARVVVGAIVIWMLGVGLWGCSAPADAGYGRVNEEVRGETGYATAWTRGAGEDELVNEMVAELLSDELRLDEAVQIALVNNRHLQAQFERLGISRGALIQAGLPENPVFEGQWWFFDAGPAIELVGVQDVISIVTIPMRRRLEGNRFEAVQLETIAAAVRLAAEVKRGYFVYVANRQLVERLQELVQTTKGAYMVAERLREAGNIRQVEVFGRRVAYEESKVALNAGVEQLARSRESLNVLMGLWGEQTRWETPGRLPGVAARREQESRGGGEQERERERSAGRMPAARGEGRGEESAGRMPAARGEGRGEDSAGRMPAARGGAGAEWALDAGQVMHEMGEEVMGDWTSPGESWVQEWAGRLGGPPVVGDVSGEAGAVLGEDRLEAEGGAGLLERDFGGPAVGRFAAVEREALESSLELAIAWRLVEAQVGRTELETTLAIFPFLEGGATGERDAEGEWAAGPAVTTPVPFWDWGQGQVPQELSRLRGRVEEYAAVATTVRAVARAAEARLQASRARAAYMEEVVLPLHMAQTAEAQLQYNAMQDTVFTLLGAKVGQIVASQEYVLALLEYWLARTDMEELLAGSLPAGVIGHGAGAGAGAAGVQELVGPMGRRGAGRGMGMGAGGH